MVQNDLFWEGFKQTVIRRREMKKMVKKFRNILVCTVLDMLHLQNLEILYTAPNLI